MEREWKEFKKRKIEALKIDRRIDEKIKPIVNKINSYNHMCTSSSCSGRIALLEIKYGKEDAHLFAKWHRAVKEKEIIEKINEYNGDKTLWFRCEPFILHIFAQNLNEAKKLLSICREAGLKRGGIWGIKKYVFIEIIGTHGFALPVKNKGKLVNKKYIKYILKIANKTLNKNFKQLEKLLKLLKNLQGCRSQVKRGSH